MKRIFYLPYRVFARMLTRLCKWSILNTEGAIYKHQASVILSIFIMKQWGLLCSKSLHLQPVTLLWGFFIIILTILKQYIMINMSQVIKWAKPWGLQTMLPGCLAGLKGQIETSLISGANLTWNKSYLETYFFWVKTRYWHWTHLCNPYGPDSDEKLRSDISFRLQRLHQL